ncbi:MAG: hypothetical protein Q7J29_11750 [Stagnimonas sp.]|nr:hypothetical protein [Stagnimonas sp.]
MNNFQRVGSVSNSHVGRAFEVVAYEYFLREEGLSLTKAFPVAVGTEAITKMHRFDLGSNEPSILVECKSHRWTETGNMPSAKVTVWNEAMFYFHIAPVHFRKVLFVVRDTHSSKSKSLAEYYAHCYAHLIPASVSIIEFNETTNQAVLVKQGLTSGSTRRRVQPAAR